MWRHRPTQAGFWYHSARTSFSTSAIASPLSKDNSAICSGEWQPDRDVWDREAHSRARVRERRACVVSAPVRLAALRALCRKRLQVRIEELVAGVEGFHGEPFVLAVGAVVVVIDVDARDGVAREAGIVY